MQEASEIFAALTGGRYARVQIDRRMNLEAGEQDAVMHRLLSLSGGTADGLYLAVRLAICRLLLPASAPIVLDDALAMLDDTRLRLALQLLQQEADSARSSCSPARAARRRLCRTEKKPPIAGCSCDGRYFYCGQALTASCAMRRRRQQWMK